MDRSLKTGSIVRHAGRVHPRPPLSDRIPTHQTIIMKLASVSFEIAPLDSPRERRASLQDDHGVLG